jgi:hypothetical protein
MTGSTGVTFCGKHGSGVRSNGGAAGVDAETIQAIEQSGAEKFLAETHETLRAGFRPKRSAQQALEAIRVAGSQGWPKNRRRAKLFYQ